MTHTHTRGGWRANHLFYYDGVSHERVLPVSAIVFVDDFIGPGNVIPAASSPESGMQWTQKIVGAAPPTVAPVADAANGVIQCALTSASQKQDAALYMDDSRHWSLEQGMIFETRVKISVIPTLVAEAVIGLVGDWADGPDAITYSAFFTADGSGEIFCEMDDNANNRSATSGITVVNTAWHIYRIDFADIANVRFYIDGNDVTPAATQSYAATDANAILQPYLGLYKASGAGLGTIQVDFVRMWMERE